jgi:hypothetical protein
VLDAEKVREAEAEVDENEPAAEKISAPEHEGAEAHATDGRDGAEGHSRRHPEGPAAADEARWLAAGQRRHLAELWQGRPRGDSDEDIVVRIKADAPVLRPDEPVPANPVL